MMHPEPRQLLLAPDLYRILQMLLMLELHDQHGKPIVCFHAGQSLQSVSYTHLDVYKRQRYRRGLFKNARRLLLSLIHI